MGFMKNIVLLVLILAVILVACAPGVNEIQTAIAQTQSAQPVTSPPIPTPTSLAPTSVSLKDIQIDSLVFQSGDLPASFKLRDSVSPRLFSADHLKLMINAAQVLLSHENDVAGGSIILALFDSTFNRNQVYDALIRDRFGGPPDPTPLTDIGEKGVHIDVNIAFVRCKALVYITIDRYTDFGQEGALKYAQILDKRLTAIVCP